MSYCAYCEKESTSDLHKIYHDRHYGYPLENDDELFGRLILEINQAGLSWETILKKADAFRAAFSGFSIKAISRYGEEDRERLLNDSSIIRNRLKIDAVIYNAGQVLEIQSKNGTFSGWLESHGKLTRDEWVKVFKRNFKFVGGEIVNEFLMSSGYLPGAHEDSCPVFDEIKRLNPVWMQHQMS